jgi:hypothetical protein
VGQGEWDDKMDMEPNGGVLGKKVNIFKMLLLN